LIFEQIKYQSKRLIPYSPTPYSLLPAYASQFNNQSRSLYYRYISLEPLLTEIVDNYPIAIANGLPILDNYLRWPGCELFIMGGWPVKKLCLRSLSRVLSIC
jgi:hypothetical protein